MKWHKYRPDELISKFTTPNETVRVNYFDFDQYWRTRAAGCSEREIMSHFCIERLRGACPDNNQDLKNAASVYSATVLTTGSNFYTNVSKS